MKKLANALASNPAWRFVSYTSATPTIATVTPSTGAEKDEVVIAGTNCKDVRKVLFGATEATFWTVDSDTQITARVPAGTGTVDVVVQTAGGTATKTNGFTYVSAAPTLTSSNYTQGDTAGGGQSIVLTGSGFTGVTGAGGVTFLGTNATVYTVDSDTQITAVLPAHAAGAGNIVVTHPTNGASNALAFEYWSPASLTTTGWWRASYSGSPWADGSGNARDLAEATNPPATGAAQGGYTPSDFDGTNDKLSNATDITSFVATGAGTIVALFAADTAVAATGNTYDDATIIRDGNTDLGLSFTTSGVTAYAYSGGYKQVPVACAADSAYRLAMMRWDSTNLGLTLNSAAESTTPCGALTVMTGNVIAGQGYLGSKYFDGRLLELFCIASKLADADYTKTRKYCQQRYGVSV